MTATALDLPTLRTSERSTFKRCPWRWLQEYRFGFKPRFVEADAAWFGIGVHEALAQWYLPGKKRGPHPADTFYAWCGDEMEWARTYLDDMYDAPVWEDARELGTTMLEEYVKQYGKDSQWQIISVERPFRIKILDGGRPVGYFQSRWDGVFRDLADGRICLLETKTAAQITLAYLENDDQGGSYWAVASTVLRAEGVLKPNEDIARIEYNFLRKAMPDDRPRDANGLYLNKPTKEHYVAALTGIDGWAEDKLRKMKVDDLDSIAAANHLVVQGEISKSQPPPYFQRVPIERARVEQATQLQKIADEIEWMNAIRTGALKPIKITTKDCPRCPLWHPCTLHERGSDAYQTVLKADFIQRDPYADMRKSAAELWLLVPSRGVIMPPVRAKTSGVAARPTRGVRKSQTAKQAKEAPTRMTEAVIDIQEVSLARHKPPTNICLYGPPGGGKTVLAGGAPNAVFLSTEIEGAVSAKVTGSTARLWPAPTWEHAVSGVQKAERELGEDDWLIVDSGTRMQELYMMWILRTINEQHSNRDLDIPAIQDHQKYQNGFKRWYGRIIDMPCNTIFICNSMNAEDAEGEPRVIPLILGKKGEISDSISAQAGVILYYSVSRESREAEATGSNIVRRLLCQPYPPWLAKDRYDALGSFIDVGYRDFTVMADIIGKIDRAKKDFGPQARAGATSRPRRSARRVAQ